MHDAPQPLPFAYPRAGRGGVAVAALVEQILVDLAEQGVPPSALGPTLVDAYARFYRRLPTFTPGVDKTQIPLLYSLLGSGTGPLKMSQADAAYQDRPNASGQRCGNCSSSYTNNVVGESICSQIEGVIEPGGWCRLWNTDRG